MDNKKYQLTLTQGQSTLTFTGSLDYCKKLKIELTSAMNSENDEQHYYINIVEV